MYGTFNTTEVVKPGPALGATVTVIPGTVGNVMRVEFSTTATALDNPDGDEVTWQLWAAGDVGVTTSLPVNGKVVALRFTQISGSGNDKYEIVE